RLVGWMIVATFAAFALAGSRAYYAAPIYPVLIAAGSMNLVRLLDRVAPPWGRLGIGVQWTAIAVAGTTFALLVMPMAPIGSRLWIVTSRLHDQFREEVGWPELAEAVAGVYRSLSPAERDRTGILTGNYGEGGALNLFGPALGLPRAMCLT